MQCPSSSPLISCVPVEFYNLFSPNCDAHISSTMITSTYSYGLHMLTSLNGCTQMNVNGAKLSRSASMQRVASQEHLAKRSCGPGPTSFMGQQPMGPPGDPSMMPPPHAGMAPPPPYNYHGETHTHGAMPPHTQMYVPQQGRVPLRRQTHA